MAASCRPRLFARIFAPGTSCSMACRNSPAFRRNINPGAPFRCPVFIAHGGRSRGSPPPSRPISITPSTPISTSRRARCRALVRTMTCTTFSSFKFPAPSNGRSIRRSSICPTPASRFARECSRTRPRCLNSTSSPATCCICRVASCTRPIRETTLPRMRRSASPSTHGWNCWRSGCSRARTKSTSAARCRRVSPTARN